MFSHCNAQSMQMSSSSHAGKSDGYCWKENFEDFKKLYLQFGTSTFKFLQIFFLGLLAGAVWLLLAFWLTCEIRVGDIWCRHTGKNFIFNRIVSSITNGIECISDLFFSKNFVSFTKLWIRGCLLNFFYGRFTSDVFVLLLIAIKLKRKWNMWG